jgi:short-subunit dehydrogenase
VNVTGPLVFTYHFARPMLRRKTGGIILMSSGAGLQGSPYYAHYSATKAYDIALAQALWGEFRHDNVDVLACVAGLTLSTASQAFEHIDASQLQTPDELVAEAMDALGNQSTLIAGEHNRWNRKRLEQLPTDRRIEAIASHSVALFLGSVRPEQSL